MAVSDQIERIKTNIANAYATAESMGATIPELQNSENLSTTIGTIPSGGGGGASVTKGLVINEYDEEGYATDISLVGFDTIPAYYMYYSMWANTSTGAEALFSRAGSNIHLPDNITAVGEYAFNQCTTLNLNYLPDTITYIGKYAFSQCRAFNPDKLPASLKTIATFGLANCTALALTSLPDSLEELESYAFNGCTMLAITSVPEGVTRLTSNVFYNCKGLTELTFNGNITQIEQSALSNCANLSKIVFPNVTAVPTLDNRNAFNGTPIASGTGYVYFPDALVESIKVASGWSTYAAQIKGVSELPTS